jgi:hypothetical protein
MSEESRLGRESIEVSYALKTLVQAGVRVWLYLEERERTLDSPTDKIMLSLTAFADELEREKASVQDAGVWKTNTTYREGDIVTHRGNGWICHETHVSGNDVSHNCFRLFVRAGRDAR